MKKIEEINKKFDEKFDYVNESPTIKNKIKSFYRQQILSLIEELEGKKKKKKKTIKKTNTKYICNHDFKRNPLQQVMSEQERRIGDYIQIGSGFCWSERRWVTK